MWWLRYVNVYRICICISISIRMNMTYTQSQYDDNKINPSKYFNKYYISIIYNGLYLYCVFIVIIK